MSTVLASRLCAPRRRAAALVLLLSVSVFGAARPSGAVENDPLLWLTAIVGHGITDDLRAGLFLQTRFADDVSEFERLVVNPSLSWKLPRGFAVAGGYDAHVIRNPRVRLEHRSWEQLSLRHEVAGIRLFHRFRLEQRFIEGEDGAANRLRWWIEGQVPLFDTEWRGVLRNEAFFDLDAKRQGPTESGFGETRLFAGFDRDLPGGYGLEAGYQLQYIDRRRREDLAAHTVLITVFYPR